MDESPHGMKCTCLLPGLTCRAVGSVIRDAAERILCNSESHDGEIMQERKDESCSRHSGEE